MRGDFQSKWARFAAALLCVALISSLILLLVGAGHCCPGQGCRLCEILEKTSKRLSFMVLGLASALLSRRAVLFASLSAARRGGSQSFLSPIQMRVRMND